MKTWLFKFCWMLFCTTGIFLPENIAQTPDVKWVVPPIIEADKISELSPQKDDSRFIVFKKDRSGVCDKNGKMILPVQYFGIELLSCGWIKASDGNKRYVFNARGENISLPYEKFIALNNGLAEVNNNGLWGIVNMEGEEIVPLKYNRLNRQGKSYVFYGDDGEELPYTGVAEVPTKNEKRVATAQARSKLAGHYYVDKGPNQCGFVNMKGDTVVPAIYRFEAIHPQGYMVATLDGGKTWGVIDKMHKTLYPFTAERIGRWTNSGLLPVRFEKQWALLRFPKAETVIPFGQYDHIEVYDSDKDLFLVAKNGLKGLINAKGKQILPCAYSYISQADHTTTELASPDNKRGFCYRPTGYVQEPMYKGIKNLNDSLVIVYDDSIRHALLDARNGQVIIPFSDFWLDRNGLYFDFHKKYDPKVVETYKGQLHGLYDRKGKLVYAPDSVEIYPVAGTANFWVCPHFKDSGENYELRTPDGKVLRSMPKKGANLTKVGVLLNYIRNSNGQQEARQFTYVDKEGKESYYTKLDNLEENLRRVSIENKWWGCVDAEGKVVIPLVFEALEPSKDGYIRAKYQGKWGVIQNPRFDYFEQFEKEIKK